MWSIFASHGEHPGFKLGPVRVEFAYFSTCLNKILLDDPVFAALLVDSQPTVLSLLITKNLFVFFLESDSLVVWRLMSFWSFIRTWVKSLIHHLWDTVLKTKRLNLQERKGERKTSNFQNPRGPWRRAFYQAFQPSVNYSRQRRRTRTLSAITLHSSLPSVSNINIMAFIFSSRLWAREASLKSALSLSLFLSVRQYMTFEKTDHNVLWWPTSRVGI